MDHHRRLGHARAEPLASGKAIRKTFGGAPDRTGRSIHVIPDDPAVRKASPRPGDPPPRPRPGRPPPSVPPRTRPPTAPPRGHTLAARFRRREPDRRHRLRPAAFLRQRIPATEPRTTGDTSRMDHRFTPTPPVRPGAAPQGPPARRSGAPARGGPPGP